MARAHTASPSSFAKASDDEQPSPKGEGLNAQATVLPEDVAKQYDITEGVLAQFVCSEFGLVDLTKIDLDMAVRLEQKGYLKKK